MENINVLRKWIHHHVIIKSFFPVHNLIEYNLLLLSVSDVKYFLELRTLRSEECLYFFTGRGRERKREGCQVCDFYYSIFKNSCSLRKTGFHYWISLSWKLGKEKQISEHMEFFWTLSAYTCHFEHIIISCV